MPSFLTIGGRPGARTKRHGGGAIAAPGVPFQVVRVYDDSGGGMPSSPTQPPTGRLLLELDLTVATFAGTPLTLASTIGGNVLVLGFPSYVRSTTLDAATATDTPYALPPSVSDPTTAVEEDNEPDSSFLIAPGPWQPGTRVEFGPGDLVYAP